MALLSLAEVIGGLLLLVGVGVLLRATGLLSAEDARPINTVIVYVGLPALIFQAVQPARLTPELAIVAGIAWAVTLLSFGLAWAAGRLLKLERRVAGGLMFAAALGNTGYIGYPVSQALLGDTGLVRAVFYDVFGTVLVLLTVGFAVAARFGESDDRRGAIRDILRFPAVIAVLIALLLHPFEIPKLVSDGLDAFANMTVPLIMISVGVSLKARAIGTHARTIAVASVIKLLVAPLVALLIGGLVLGDPSARRVVVVEAGMPSMMLGLVIGMRFGLDADMIAAAILVTTAASVLTVPLLQLLV